MRVFLWRRPRGRAGLAVGLAFAMQERAPVCQPRFRLGEVGRPYRVALPVRTTFPRIAKTWFDGTVDRSRGP